MVFTAVDFTATEIQPLEEETFTSSLSGSGGRTVVLQRICFLPFGLLLSGALVIPMSEPSRFSGQVPALNRASGGNWRLSLLLAGDGLGGEFIFPCWAASIRLWGVYIWGTRITGWLAGLSVSFYGALSLTGSF